MRATSKQEGYLNGTNLSSRRCMTRHPEEALSCFLFAYHLSEPKPDVNFSFISPSPGQAGAGDRRQPGHRRGGGAAVRPGGRGTGSHRPLRRQAPAGGGAMLCW